MKKLFLYFIIAIFLCPVALSKSLCAQQTLIFSSVDNHRTITLGRSILEQAYQQLGIEISVIGMPADRALRSANQGITDGDVSRIAQLEEDYPNLIRIDVPIRIDSMHLFVRAGEEFSVKSWDSIPENYLLGYRRGHKTADHAIVQYDIRSITNDSVIRLFRQLKRGFIDVVFAGPIGLDILATEPEFKTIVPLNPPIHTNYLYHYLHKKHAALVPEITRILQEMEDQGTSQLIRDQYEKEHPHKPF
jgi:polar amino acid transport system substrate-binding protein